MELKNFYIKLKNNYLLENVNIKFEVGKINHLLGKNGVGKTCLAKSIINAFKFQGSIETEAENMILIGSYTNVPNDLTIKDILSIINKLYSNELIKQLVLLLKIDKMDIKTNIKNLSDGQKQKVKILFFLSSNPDLIILDEFTNALDRNTIIELYEFFNNYVKNKNITIINITHNLSDIENMIGNYYLIENKKIVKVETKEMILEKYLKI